MIFVTEKIDIDICYTCVVGINGICIDRVYNTHFRGYDDKLNWKEHIKMIQSKIFKNNCNNL